MKTVITLMYLKLIQEREEATDIVNLKKKRFYRHLMIVKMTVHQTFFYPFCATLDNNHV